MFSMVPNSGMQHFESCRWGILVFWFTQRRVLLSHIQSVCRSWFYPLRKHIHFITNAVHKRNDKLKIIGEGKQKIAFYPNFKELAAPAGAQSDMMLDIIICDKNGSDVGRVSISLNILTQAAPSDETIFTHRDSVFTSSATPTFKVGDVFEGQYIGGMDWYKATVKAVNAPCSNSSSAIGLITYQVLYDDGDVENEIEEARMRHLISTLATPNATPLGVSHTLQALYAIGDAVEALYGRGIDWYAASVTAVTTAGKCNLLYDDGDVEDDVSLTRMRAQPSAASRQTAASTSPCSTLASQPDISMCLCGRELVLGCCADCNAHIAPKGAPVALTEGKEGDCDMLQTGLKSSKDAFFDNYLDELSDDDGPDPKTGTAAYGDLRTPYDDTILKIANSGDCKISVEEALIHDLQTEGGYEEDFDP